MPVVFSGVMLMCFFKSLDKKKTIVVIYVIMVYQQSPRPGPAREKSASLSLALPGSCVSGVWCVSSAVSKSSCRVFGGCVLCVSSAQRGA